MKRRVKSRQLNGACRDLRDGVLGDGRGGEKKEGFKGGRLLER